MTDYSLNYLPAPLESIDVADEWANLTGECQRFYDEDRIFILHVCCRPCGLLALGKRLHNEGHQL